MDLATLLERCRQGDDLAWEAFVRQFQRRVYSIAYGYAPRPEEASDLTQDVFIRLYETRGRWAPPEIFPAWMVKVARNLCLDHLRRKKARPPTEDIQADEMYDLAASNRSPEAEASGASERTLVWRALQSLGHLSREMVLLKEIQGLSLQDIAAMLKVPIGTVKSRSNRARLELAERVLALQQPGGAEPLG